MKKTKASLTLAVLAAGVVIGGCKPQENVQAWVASTEQSRTEVRAQLEGVPYREEQHLALKTYFGGLAKMAATLKADPKAAEQYNAAAQAGSLDELCSKVFLSKRDWAVAMAGCLKNGFFVCSEEVRAYPEVVGSFRAQLSPALQQRFDEASSCASATQ